MSSKRITLLTLSALASCVVAQAQTGTTTGAVRGTVVQKGKTALAGAQITLRNRETGAARVATSSAKGEFMFSLLAPGTYEITVTAPGMRTLKDSNMRVALGQTLAANFELDKVEAAAVVEVVAETAALDTAQINTMSAIGTDIVESVPINGRNFTDLVLLTPGAATNSEGYRQSIEGARGVQNNLQIDGGSYNSKFNGEQRGGTRIPFAFGQDSIRELQVISNSYDAQYGDSNGAIINAVTKSGTNQFFGSAFVLFRPNSMVASVKTVPYDPKGTTNDPAVRDRQSTQSQGGFSFGGPLIKDRLHFFVNFETVRFKQQNVPAWGYDNSTGNSVNDWNTFWGPGGTGRRLLTTNDGRSLYDESQSPWDNEQRHSVLMGRVDWTINPNHRLALRVNYQHYKADNDTYAGSRRSDVAWSNNTANQYNSLSWVLELNSILTPQLMNEARVQFASERRPTTPNSTSSSRIGISGSSGTFFSAGQSSLDPRGTDEITTQIQDNLTYLTGDWSFKGGVDLQFISFNNLFYQNQAGSWSFRSYDQATQWATNSGASLSGMTYAQNYSPLGGVCKFDEQFLAGYLQAQYQGLMNKRLMLSVGVRYSAERYSSNPNPNAKLQGLDQMPNTYALDPRFGFSLDMFGNGKTVLRGGYGWFSVSNPTQTASGAIMNNGINMVPYSISASTYPDLFKDSGLLSPLNRIVNNRLTPLSAAELSTMGLGRIDLTLIDPEARMAQARAASLAVEQDLGRGFQVGVSVRYKEFYNQQYFVNINLGQADPTTGAISPAAIYNDGYPTTFNKFSTSSRPNRAIVRGRTLDLNGYGNVGLSKYDGRGRYQALILEASRRADNGFGFRSFLTFAKARDNNSNERATASSSVGYTENPADPLGSWALSDNDRAFRAVLVAYSPEFWGFRTSGNFTYTTGRPYTAVYYDDINGDGKYIDSVNGRNTYRQPSEKTFDLRVSRFFKVVSTSRVRFEGIVDIYNLFNWANQRTSLYTYATNPTTPGGYQNSFGQINVADNKTREVQFTLKMKF